ncbi:MAG: hypothetical protein AAF063_24200 [Cyanobacteria bacterium J06643_5]
MNQPEHLLKKQDKTWVCQVCGLSWKRKPKRKCEGIPAIRYDESPKGAIWDFNLYRNNLTKKREAKPIAYHHKPSFRHDYCYKLEDCEKWLENVPDLILTKQEKDKLGYKTKRQLEKMHLQPKPDARACGVYYWDKEEGDGFAVFYHPDDTEFFAADQFLSKTTLKKTYLLSEGWVKRLGEPDKLADNPHSYTHPIKLYSRKRVEKCLADNAEDYCIWLDKRDTYVAIFEQNKDKIAEARELVRNQQKMCLRCASSCALENGLFCVIYPSGLERYQMPCADFYERNN